MAILGFAVAILVAIRSLREEFRATAQELREEFGATAQELRDDVWDVGLRVDMVDGAVARERSKLSRFLFIVQIHCIFRDDPKYLSAGASLYHQQRPQHSSTLQ